MIKIETEKVIVEGRRFRRILRIEMLTAQQLPKEYIRNAPYVVLLNGCVVARERDSETSYYMLSIIGALIPEEYYQQALKFIELCRNRLQKINKRLSWEGTETITI